LSTTETILFLLLMLGVLVGLALFARVVLVRVGSYLFRPHVTANITAYPSGARSSNPLTCSLTTTPAEIVIRAGTRRGIRRRSRWDHPVVVLLGQRQSTVLSKGTQELTRNISSERGAEPLFFRFRQSRLPLTWRLWQDPPVRGAPIGADYRGPSHLAPAISARSRRVPERRSVLHLVGTPVSTAAGWRLRIPAAASSSAGYQQQSRSVHVGEELVGADDLIVDSTALVVLQAEPVDGPPQPLGELYEGTCALAADIRDAGAGAVLVVPPLPDGLAQTVVMDVRQIVKRSHKAHPAHVLDLAQKIKRDVAMFECPGGESARPSPDVLLFA
jgi:hypothetical protein